MGCPEPANRSQPLVAQWAEVLHIMGHVNEILLLNKFLSDC